MGWVCPTIFPSLNEAFQRALTDDEERSRLMDVTSNGDPSELVNAALSTVNAYSNLENGMSAAKAWPPIQSSLITLTANISLSEKVPMAFVAGPIQGLPQTTIVVSQDGITIICSGSA